MKVYNIKNMVRGWFIGNFIPTIYKTDKFEVGVKKYNKGEYEISHYHNISTEITFIASGKVKMSKKIYGEGDIIIISPGEVTDFECLSDNTITVVVKIPSVRNDKFIIT